METTKLMEELQALKEEVAQLKEVVHKGIIEPIEKDYNDRKYKEATDKWRERFYDKLKPFEAKLKATEGDDFDIVTASYDEWNKTDADPDEWVDMLIESINETLKPLADAFGVAQEDLNATIEVRDGEVADVQADTEPEENEASVEGADEVSNEAVDEAVDESESAEEPTGEEELSEEEQFQRELDEAYEKMKERRY